MKNTIYYIRPNDIDGSYTYISNYIVDNEPGTSSKKLFSLIENMPNKGFCPSREFSGNYTGSNPIDNIQDAYKYVVERILKERDFLASFDVFKEGNGFSTGAARNSSKIIGHVLKKRIDETLLLLHQKALAAGIISKVLAGAALITTAALALKSNIFKSDKLS